MPMAHGLHHVVGGRGSQKPPQGKGTFVFLPQGYVAAALALKAWIGLNPKTGYKEGQERRDMDGHYFLIFCYFYWKIEGSLAIQFPLLGNCAGWKFSF